MTLKYILCWVLFCIVAVVGGELCDLYEQIHWYDLMLHFVAGGLLMNMAGNYFRPISVVHLVALGSVVTNVLVLWEVFEYFMDTYLDFNMQKDGIKDTMEDILIGKLGCLSAMLFVKEKDT